MSTLTADVANQCAACLSDGMEIGVNIRHARERKQWSQSQLAKLIGIDQARFSRLERGDGLPTLPQILAISDATGASLDELIRGMEVERSPELTPDEQTILTVVRALELSAPEVIRALNEFAARKLAGERFEPARAIGVQDLTESALRREAERARDQAEAIRKRNAELARATGERGGQSGSGVDP